MKAPSCRCDDSNSVSSYDMFCPSQRMRVSDHGFMFLGTISIEESPHLNRRRSSLGNFQEPSERSNTRTRNIPSILIAKELTRVQEFYVRNWSRNQISLFYTQYHNDNTQFGQLSIICLFTRVGLLTPLHLWMSACPLLQEHHGVRKGFKQQVIIQQVSSWL